MNHFYQNIPGWFDFEDVYSNVVRAFPSGSRFVEIGCWLGKSSIYLAVEIINSGKDIKLSCVDNWTFTDDKYEDHLYPSKNTAYINFLNNIRKLPTDVITVHKMSSIEASKLYEDNSLDFVFIDGSHVYECVKKDLESWYPKVKNGCIIAGHDISFEGVTKATDEFFTGKEFWKVSSGCWLHYKK